MSYLLDTSVCIDYMRHPESPMHAWLRVVDSDTVHLCSVVVGELLVGVCKGTTKSTRIAVGKFLATFPSYPFDDPAADRYARLRADLERKGQVIGPNDMLIAAVAVARKLTLVTGNPDEFRRVQGLTCLALDELASGKTAT